MSGVPSWKTSRAPTSRRGGVPGFSFCPGFIGAHHTGQAVAVGDADGGIRQGIRLLDKFAGMRSAAQEGKIGGDGEFGIAHANRPCRYQRGANRSADIGRRDRARNAGPGVFRSGNNPGLEQGVWRSCRALSFSCVRGLASSGRVDFLSTIPARCAPGLRRVSRHICIAANESILGGPSGVTGKLALISSGLSSSRKGRSGGSFAWRLRVQTPVEITLLRRHRHALRFGNMGVLGHETLHPMFAETGGEAVDQKIDLPAGILISIEAGFGGMGFFRQAGFQPDQVETEAGVQRIGQRVQPLVAEAAASHRDRARVRRSDRDAFHLAVGAEEDGFQKAQALAFAFQDFAKSNRPGCAGSCSMTSWVTTGSAKRCSARRSGRGRRGVSGFSSAPSITCRRVRNALPSRAASSRAAALRHLGDGLEAGAFQRAQPVLAAIQRRRWAAAQIMASSCPGGAMRADWRNAPAPAPPTKCRRWRLEPQSPGPRSFRITCLSIGASPPKRCAAPVMSRNRPSGGFSCHQRA